MSTDTDIAETDELEASALESVREAIDGLRDAASVQRVFGDPIEREDKTVVPVARVAYGFGAGAGSGMDTEAGEDEDAGEGSGGGGGLSIKPVGALEITDRDTRFVRVSDWKRTALAVGAGVVLGVLLGRR